MDELIKKLTIRIAGRPYELMIAPDDTARIEALVDQIESDLADLQQRYGQRKSNQDLLAMLLLQYGEALQQQRAKPDAKEAIPELDRLNRRLDEALVEN